MVMNIASALSAYKQTASGGMMSASDTPSGDDGFAATLNGFMGDALQSVRKGEQMAAAGVVGKADLQDVVLAANNAEMMVQTISTLREKVVTAYQEVIRMTV